MARRARNAIVYATSTDTGANQAVDPCGQSTRARADAVRVNDLRRMTRSTSCSSAGRNESDATDPAAGISVLRSLRAQWQRNSSLGESRLLRAWTTRLSHLDQPTGP